MEISPLFSQLTSTPRGNATSQTDIAEDFNSFLNLLTVQLQHQDPLEPLDTNQFTEQIVNMTQVEQTVSMNERLGALIDAQETQRIQTAVDFVGKKADALGDILPALGADGVEMFYSLPEQAEFVRVEVVDTAIDDPLAAVVHKFDAPSREMGLHRLSWNGLDAGGAPVDPNKTYRLSVTAIDRDGEQVQARIGYSGVVDEIRNENGELMLSIGGRQANLNSILAARTPTVSRAAS